MYNNEQKKTLKYNFIFNFIKVSTSVLFPLITVPYLSRILLPNGMGKIEFANSVIQYFIWIASLGIPIYGIREIARIKGEKSKLIKTLSELFVINIIMTIMAYVLFLICFLFVAKLQKEKLLFFIISLNIIFSTLGLDWFYQGIEKYDYITIRSIIVKIISLLLMFALVKKENDYIIAAGITVVSSVGSNIFNIYKAKKFISIGKNTFRNIRRHIKPILSSFSLILIVSIYLQLTSVLLGFIKDSKDVAFYMISNKLTQILLLLITTLSTVVLPRVSNLIRNNEFEEYRKLIKKVISFNLVLGIPAFIYMCFYSKEIITIFFGPNFLEANYAMKIISFTLLTVPISGLLGNEVLYVNNKDKQVILSVGIGAVLNIILNLILIPFYSFNGAVVSYVLTEILVLSLRVKFSSKYIELNFLKDYNKNVLGGLILLMYVCIFKKYIDGSFLRLFIVCFTGFLVYLVSLVIMKDELVSDELKKIVNKGKK